MFLLDAIVALLLLICNKEAGKNEMAVMQTQLS